MTRKTTKTPISRYFDAHTNERGRHDPAFFIWAKGIFVGCIFCFTKNPLTPQSIPKYISKAPTQNFLSMCVVVSEAQTEGDMGAKEQMIAILRDRDTARIRFTYRNSGNTAVINRDSFTRVADNLANGHLNVVEGRHTQNRVTYSAWRDGNDAANTFYLGNNQRWSRDFNALVVHEAVHAFFDLERTTIPWLDNEAVAYIAQGYYLRNSGYPASRLEEDEPYEIGYRVARELARGRSGSDWMFILRSKLDTDSRYSSYIHGSFTGNG